VAVLVLVASVLTTLEFPVMFGLVNRSELAGVLVLTARNLVLLAATVLSAYRLWRSTRRREVLTTVVLPAGQVVAQPQYPVRPGIAYEQDLLDDLAPADRT